jgi:predicted 2-oxoglutarate/Fe(II)-dependent dioxygenase YbiX
MSKRLQVIFDDGEYRELQRVARGHRLTVSAWVRQAIRAAQRRAPERRADLKVAAVREAARHSYPTADPRDMLAQIERGYLGPVGQ